MINYGTPIEKVAPRKLDLALVALFLIPWCAVVYIGVKARETREHFEVEIANRNAIIIEFAERYGIENQFSQDALATITKEIP